MVKQGEVKKEAMRSMKAAAFIQLGLITGIIVLVNFISTSFFTRFDLTSDNRFTLSEKSKSLVGNLKDIVFVKVYLAGDFSPGFSRLSESTREMLDELRTYSDGNLEYEFIDPSANPDEKERNLLYAQLYQKGIQPTTVEERTSEGVKRTFIFPGAVVSYANVEISVPLLKSQIGIPPELMLNNSIQNLEFEICNAIQKATDPARPVIGFLEGHGELDTSQVADFAQTLKAYYNLKRVTINGELNALDDLKALVIAKPDSAFNEYDKFIIDQFVMNGGRLLWLVDPLIASMDSMDRRGEFMAPARDLKLDDMLFRYGARVNYDLVQDLMASMIPVVTGMVGNQPKQQLLPWYYFPVMTPESKHPIVNNLNSIKGQFVSSVEAINAARIQSTVLLTTSKYSKIIPAPARVSLGIMQYKPDPKLFPIANVPVAVLMEGTFTSLYKNRIPPAIAESREIGFKEQSLPGRMVVIGDGDLIRNDIQKGQPIALGYDKYTGVTYGNKTFLLNVIDYLCDDKGMMSIRNKEYRMRLIDPAVLEEDTKPLRMINLTVPLLIVILSGILKFYLRKHRFAS